MINQEKEKKEKEKKEKKKRKKRKRIKIGKEKEKGKRSIKRICRMKKKYEGVEMQHDNQMIITVKVLDH